MKRTVSAIALVGMLGAAALWMHSLAGSPAFTASFDLLGPASKVIVLVLLGVLLLLGCRHLVMIGLAARDLCMRPSGSEPAPRSHVPFISIIVPPLMA